MEPIQSAVGASGDGETTSATGFPNRRDANWLLGLVHLFQQGQAFGFELGDGDFLHVLLSRP